ncbi:MAG: 50S ribosomal protein L6 [Candidatus Nealsonbacteria bacterium]|nr:50S ribosomal protein L6 [Candidatus Nealsonbacteria bacterium]
MSRVGKKPILIPAGVDVKIEGQKVTVKGPKGEISREFRPELEIVLEDKKLLVKIKKETKQVRALWGLTRALLANLVKGVTDGYEKKLEIEGVGFKANIEGDQLVLNVGFSHSVKVKTPEGIKFLVEKNVITVSGINKELVGQITATIRAVRPPEPYKGKGIRYLGEHIRRKLGKKAVATAK